MEEQKEKAVGLKYPATFNEMQDEGFHMAPYPKNRKLCTCGQVFYWWITKGGKWIPMSLVEQSLWMPHHATCKNVQEYRQAVAKHAKRTEKPKPKQEVLF